jgi:hypothetical protein
MNIIYVLKLSQNKFYIGKTLDLKKRYNQHLSGLGSEWTKKYKVIDIIDSFEDKGGFSELCLTLQYMKHYGIDNVRGADYVKINLTQEQINEIKKHISSENGECFNCKKTGHYVSECTYQNTPFYIKLLSCFYTCCTSNNGKKYTQLTSGTLTFGKYKGETYEYVWENHHKYCEWVMGITSSNNKDFRDFQDWCRVMYKNL